MVTLREVCREEPSASDYGKRHAPCRGRRPDFNRHQFVFRRHIEQLLAIATPPRMTPAPRGDKPFTASNREACDIDLVSPGLVRGVGDPCGPALHSGKELAFPFIPLGLEKGNGPPIGQPQDPEIELCLWVFVFIEDELPV